MKKVLVTGAGGFIGSHLTEKLVKKGFYVKAFLRYNSKNNWGWLEKSVFLKDVEIVTGDIRDFDSVNKAIKGCDTVFHLAALIGIPYSYISPLAYIKTNIEGTYNILESSKKNNLPNIIITSTSETYGTAHYVPINEEHPLTGQSPYSASKIAADQIAVSYNRSFGLPVKIVRPFNTYGPRQSARAVIPSIIIQLLNGGKKIKLGNIHPTRDLTFVKDTVSGFLHIAGCKKCNGEIVNVGMNEEISIGDLFGLISDRMNVNYGYKSEAKRIRPKKSEVERLKCDNSKIMKLTKWKPLYSLEKGIDDTIAWIKENKDIYKTDLYNI